MKSKTKRGDLSWTAAVLLIPALVAQMPNTASAATVDPMIREVLSAVPDQRDLAPYCKTDHALDTSSHTPEMLALGTAAAACMFLTGGLCAFGIGLGYAALHAGPEMTNSQARDAAEAACVNVPKDLSLDDQYVWRKSCLWLAYEINDDVLTQKDFIPPKAAPIGLNDEILQWRTQDGHPFPRVAAFAAAQKQLRSQEDTKFTSCLSDTSVVEQLSSARNLTLAQGIDLMVSNIVGHGSRYMSTYGHNDPFRWHNFRFGIDRSDTARIVKAAQAYLEYRSQGKIGVGHDEFSLMDDDAHDNWAIVEYTYADELRRLGQDGRWYIFRDLDQWALKLAQ